MYSNVIHCSNVIHSASPYFSRTKIYKFKCKKFPMTLRLYSVNIFLLDWVIITIIIHIQWIDPEVWHSSLLRQTFNFKISLRYFDLKVNLHSPGKKVSISKHNIYLENLKYFLSWFSNLGPGHFPSSKMFSATSNDINIKYCIPMYF